MSLQATVTRSYQFAGSDIQSTSETVTTDNQFQLSEVVGAGDSLLVAQGLLKAKTKLIFIQSDKSIEIEINTQVVDVAAGITLLWSENCGLANPFDDDFTEFNIVVPGTEDASVEIRFMFDN